MQQEIVTHIQDAVRPGECVDMYYANKENSEKQCYATTVENRYFLDLQSRAGGSSNTLIFNPDEGVDHVVLTLQLPAPDATVTYAGLALNRGWGYAMIRRVGIRYGGSTLYYFTGQQELIDCLADIEDTGKRDLLTQLGGQSAVAAAGGGAGDFADVAKRTAYVYIKLPHNSPSAQELPLPLPTDLLTSPVQINIEFNNFADVFQSSANVANPDPVSPIPGSLALARAQFKQIHFDDRGEQLARKHNMSEMAYSYPLKYFAQETFQVQGVQGGVVSNLTLTGLRSGNCKMIRVWVKPTADPNPWNFVAPTAVTLSVNGLIYFDSRNGEQQLWNLVDRKTSASFVNDVLTAPAAPGAWTVTPSTGYWVEIPFAQHSEVLANESELSHGLSIMNSIVNLQLTLPPLAGGPPVPTYTVVAEYLFNSTLLFSRGSAEYVF